jgi:hypothetical protein
VLAIPSATQVLNQEPGGFVAKRRAAKREFIAPKGDKRYVRRDANGRIKESDDVSRSLAQDPRQRAKTKAKRGQGDRGER